MIPALLSELPVRILLPGWFELYACLTTVACTGVDTLSFSDVAFSGRFCHTPEDQLTGGLSVGSLLTGEC